MKDTYVAELEKGFLYIEGTRVWVMGTRWNGFRGEIVAKPKDWSARSMAVKLDEWDDPVKLYRHNLFPDIEMNLKS